MSQDLISDMISLLEAIKKKPTPYWGICANFREKHWELRLQSDFYDLSSELQQYFTDHCLNRTYPVHAKYCMLHGLDRDNYESLYIDERDRVWNPNYELARIRIALLDELIAYYKSLVKS